MERDELLLEEYKALEARIQNDSSVGYNLMSALIAISSAIFTGTIALLSQVIPDRLSPELLILITLGGIGSLFSLRMAGKIQLRFRDTGDIRIARARDIEEKLHLWSFRLFDEHALPPYRTRLILYNIINPEGQPVPPTPDDLNKVRLRIIAEKRNRITALFRLFSWGFLYLWIMLIWILVNIYFFQTS